MKSLVRNFFYCLLLLLAGCTGCSEDQESISPQTLSIPSNSLNNFPLDVDSIGESENPFISTNENPNSTFSVDADGASYSNIKSYLEQGLTPPVSGVRIEEFINYFTFDYRSPEANDKIALNADLSTCPWNEKHHLLRLGIKGEELSEEKVLTSNYVFLIDVSGSMSSNNKLPLLKRGFTKMVDYLNPDDRVAIVTYAGNAQVLLQSTLASELSTIKDAIAKLGAGGGTNGAEGIKTAYEIAQQNFIEGGNNRVVLGTDGDFNIGVSSTDELIKLIEGNRESGVYLTAIGVGYGYNDEMMELVSNKGNGTYESVYTDDDIVRVFIHEKDKFFTIATDTKIKLEFDPSIVDYYRLIGYENRALTAEEYENDSTDAGEIGAGQTITAVYQLQLRLEESLTSIGRFSAKYREGFGLPSKEIEVELPSHVVDIEQSNENMRFAASVIGFGLLMKNSKYKGTINKEMVLELGKDATVYDPLGYRKEYIELLERLK